MTQNIINSVTVPAGCEVDLPQKIAGLTGTQKTLNTAMNNRHSTVESRVRSIRKKSDNLFRKGNRSGQSPMQGPYSTNGDPNTNEFEGLTGSLTIAKNPLQHSMSVAAEDSKKREAATAGFK